ncbi:MAG: dihydrofolate reductase [Deltaproteobacteria bacterium]|nr:MAG: dihydrofolate reductase [Deltaproteobacteria bacterium]
MPVNLIAAMSLNRVIGKDNKIPWKIPGEQKLFQRITEGHSIVMGRKTFESIGHPLPGRTNIVLSNRKGYSIPGCFVINHFSAVMNDAEKKNIFIIGGEKIFELFLPYADQLYLSIIQKEFEGDAYFPAFSTDDFQVLNEEQVDAMIPYRFIHFKRIRTDCVDG